MESLYVMNLAYLDKKPSFFKHYKAKVYIEGNIKKEDKLFLEHSIKLYNLGAKLVSLWFLTEEKLTTNNLDTMLDMIKIPKKLKYKELISYAFENLTAKNFEFLGIGMIKNILSDFGKNIYGTTTIAIPKSLDVHQAISERTIDIYRQFDARFHTIRYEPDDVIQSSIYEYFSR